MPDLERELALIAAHGGVICCDEVGRGALAGPVSIGAVFLNTASVSVPYPAGLRDSKLIAESKRAAMAVSAEEWVASSAVGSASAAEIDEFGIMSGLSLAASRALAELFHQGVPVFELPILLDGNYNFISQLTPRVSNVITVVKGDRDCAGLSAASIIAKVARDAEMMALSERFPVYGWAKNKGYASAQHRLAIVEHGISDFHRASWKLSAAPGDVR